VKPKSAKQLVQEASNIFQHLEKKYRPCETVFILSEVLKILSLVMLQQEVEREDPSSLEFAEKYQKKEVPANE
jgi:hypothetical protein